MTRSARMAVLLVTFVALPALAFAQATITGVVRDTSGAVLPGVTVEAASPVLIEKVRSVTTDAGGQFRVIDLRPGAYTVTFTLPGFNTVKRDGLELSGNFTATINVEMRVGAVQETITVTAESPTVDVQSATRQQVMSAELVDSLPSGRQLSNLAVLIPGVTVGSATGGRNQDVGGVLGNVNAVLIVHGSRGTDQRMTFNGMTLGTLGNAGASSYGMPNTQAFQEVAIDYAAVSAELATGGVRMNVIPKDGGNLLKGTFFATYGNSSMQGDNFSKRVQDLGLTTPDSIIRVWDVNPGVGGPLKKDRVWFYGTIRHTGSETKAAGAFINLNANKPDQWTYLPDPSQPGTNKAIWRDAQGRLTTQVTPRNKAAVTYDYQVYCGCPFGVAATRAPETLIRRRAPNQTQITPDWSSPITSKILVDAVLSYRFERWGNFAPTDLNPAMISVTEQSTGLQYRAFNSFTNNIYETLVYRVGFNYVTGSHAVKVGLNNGSGHATTRTYIGTPPVAYRFNNGVPNQITIMALPQTTYIDLDHDLGIFAQDKWTLGRMTLNYGIRYDNLALSTPRQSLGPTELAPTRNVTFEPTKALGWRDITPKSALTYDLFGDHKTALRVSLNKYLQAQTVASPVTNPAAAVVNTTTRAWTDANRDFVPQCDLINPVANGECGAMADSAFGQTRPGAALDPKLLNGFGVRGYNWEFSAGVQREIIPRMSVDVAYFRRWYGNFVATDNLTVAAGDFDPFSVVSPTDSRLPDSGQTVTGLPNLNPSKFGQPTQNLLTKAENYGKQTEHWNGVDVTTAVRLTGGLTLQGGLSTGRTSTNNCEVTAKLPEMLTNATLFGVANTALQPQQFCDAKTAFLTQVKGTATYTLPKVDVLVSAALQSFAGAVLAANYTATNAQVQPSLGRPLSGAAANVVVNILEPGAMTGERVNQLDLRFGKILRFGGRRASVNLDVYNLFNSDTVLAENSTYSAWRRPTQLITARFAKITGQFDF